jgi:hypothetical protein
MILPINEKLFALTSPYGPRPQFNDFHTGIDYAPKTSDRRCYASESGTIVEAGLGHPFTWNGRVYRNSAVVIDIGGGVRIIYLHLQSWAVKVGDYVRIGDYIGEAGAVGAATGVHLHWQINVNGQHVDPLAYMQKYNNSVSLNHMDNTIIALPGWGISHLAREAGYADYADPSRWDYIARLNGHADRTTFRIFAGQKYRVRENNEPKHTVDTANPTQQESISQLLVEAEKKLAKEKEEVEKIKLEIENQRRALKAEKLAVSNELEALRKKIDDASIIDKGEAAIQGFEPLRINLGKLQVPEVQKTGISYLFFEFSKNFTDMWNRIPSKNMRIAITIIIGIISNCALVYLAENQLPEISNEYIVISSTVLTSFVIRMFQELTRFGERELQKELAQIL